MREVATPDAWLIEPTRRRDGGVDLAVAFAGDGTHTDAAITLTREESSSLARAILAAGGEATERTLQQGGGDRG